MANRRPIRSAFRRPFRLGRRRNNGAWVSDIFVSESLSLNRADINSLQLLSQADVEATNMLVSKKFLLKRVVANFGCEFNWAPQDTFAANVGFSLLWMLWVVDVDDLDTASIKTAVKGSAIQTARVLQTGVATFNMRQLADSGVQFDGTITPVPPISIDWRGGALIKQDDEVLFTFSETHTVGVGDDYVDNRVSLSMSGFSRCLVKGS